MAESRRLKTGEEWKELLDSVDTILFDCDGACTSIVCRHSLDTPLYLYIIFIYLIGVLWVGNADLVPGAREAIAFLRSLVKLLQITVMLIIAQ